MTTSEHSLVLASTSPRRLELLERVGFAVEVHSPAAVDEGAQDHEIPKDYVRRLASEKAHAVSADEAGDRPVVAADTIVLLGNRILGKPRDEDEARSMITTLSGAWHEVITGYVVGPLAALPKAELCRTRVRFRSLKNAEIDWYLATGDWDGKAGGYAIQSLAVGLVTEIEGSYTNVVGLPLAEVIEALTALDVVPGPA